MPFIRNKHALRKCFASIDPSYSYPKYERGNLSHLQRPVRVIFPNICAWIGWIVWFKTSSQKFTKYFGSVIDGLVRIQDRQLKFLYTNECELCLFLRVVFGLWNMFREILYTLIPNYCFQMLDSTSTTVHETISGLRDEDDITRTFRILHLSCKHNTFGLIKFE